VVLEFGVVVSITRGVPENAKGLAISHGYHQDYTRRVVYILPVTSRSPGSGVPKRPGFWLPKNVMPFIRKSVENGKSMTLARGRILLQNVEPKLSDWTHPNHFDRLAGIPPVLAWKKGLVSLASKD
jgi:hypothetical protein